ncbi:hypothetical protein WAI453_009683 [Rhynchosporium graminicola]|uniref:Uncharacterized protein n=1 Tax=Rhynchosporium graminicola TaxID=2792576 RepID=A0A1E1L183_9HELO|nr:uncharacterized protein RCO7_10676 [Rhynchosporium commune]
MMVLDRLRQWEALAPQLNEIQQKLSKIKGNEVVMLLLRPSPATPNPSHESLRICYESSIVVIRTFDQIYRVDVLVFNWHTIHSIFLAIVTILYCTWTIPSVTRDTNVETLMVDLKTASNILSALAEYFVDASRGRDMLYELSMATLRRIMDSKSHRRTATDASISQPLVTPDGASDVRSRGAPSAHGHGSQPRAIEADIVSFSNEPLYFPEPSFDDFLSSTAWEELLNQSNGSVTPIDTIMRVYSMVSTRLRV